MNGSSKHHVPLCTSVDDWHLSQGRLAHKCEHLVTVLAYAVLKQQEDR
jgi:hypothetical protein